jgi:hypothetical protein
MSFLAGAKGLHHRDTESAEAEQEEEEEEEEVRIWIRTLLHPFPTSVLSALSVVKNHLLDGDTLREVARLIHVGPVCHCHAVGQELQR